MKYFYNFSTIFLFKLMWLASSDRQDTEEEVSIAEEKILKPTLEDRGLAFAGSLIFVGANVADANILAALLGCTGEEKFYIGSRGQRKRQISGQEDLA